MFYLYEYTIFCTNISRIYFRLSWVNPGPWVQEAATAWRGACSRAAGWNSTWRYWLEDRDKRQIQEG